VNSYHMPRKDDEEHQLRVVSCSVPCRCNRQIFGLHENYRRADIRD